MATACSTVLRRTFAIEAKFSAGNGVPMAADILYKNPGAIQNRMQLLHLYRLKAQLKLDLPKLQSMSKPWEHDEETNVVRVSTRCLDSLPGIEGQFDPEASAVSISVPVDKLGLKKEQEQLLLKLAGSHYNVDEGLIKWEVRDFPFKEQNQRRAMEILRDLLSYVKSGETDRFEDVPLVLPRSRRRPDLEFPKEWLRRIEHATSQSCTN